MYPSSQAGIKVLVVDSDPASCDATTGILANCGWQVVQAAGGQAALEEMAGGDLGLVVIDLDIEPGAGLEVCRRAKRIPGAAGLPIICVTGLNDDDTLQAVLAAGAYDFVSKPLRPAELQARARAALERSRGMDAVAGNRPLEEVIQKAGTICHELNQPLQFVLGMVQLVLLDMGEDEPLHGQLKSILEKIEQMGSITARLFETLKSGTVLTSKARDTVPDQRPESAR